MNPEVEIAIGALCAALGENRADVTEITISAGRITVTSTRERNEYPPDTQIPERTYLRSYRIPTA